MLRGCVYHYSYYDRLLLFLISIITIVTIITIITGIIVDMNIIFFVFAIMISGLSFLLVCFCHKFDACSLWQWERCTSRGGSTEDTGQMGSCMVRI